MSDVKYSKKYREDLHSERRATELERRAAVSESAAIEEIKNAVHLEMDGTVAVWSNGYGSEIAYVSVAEYVDQWRVSVGCCHSCQVSA